jgi:DNA-binding transcriptional ArsR family regulator
MSPVHHATDAPLAVAVVASPACELLIGLYAQEGAAGEKWLHLLGIPFETGRHDVRELVDDVARMEPLELRRHLVGAYVPAWHALVGERTLRAAARGDADARSRLLEHPRYYAGNARAALADLLPLSPAQTKRRLLDALRAAPPPATEAIERDAVRKRALGLAAEDLIDVAAGGYRYAREDEIDEVVLVPHLAARQWLLLCQHRRLRIICYPVVDEVEPELVAVGRALGDEKRVALLERLRAGDATLAELAETIGAAKSTTHHHLGLLRRAGLVALTGNARGYAYTLRAGGFAAAASAVRAFPGRS